MALGERRAALDRKESAAVRVTLAGDSSAETVRRELCREQSRRDRDPKAGKDFGLKKAPENREVGKTGCRF